MIRGRFFAVTGRGEFYQMQPCVWASIRLPAFGVSETSYRFLIDTGADNTSLNLWYSHLMLDSDHFWELERQKPSKPVKGLNSVTMLFHQVDAEIIFTHDNSKETVISTSIEIPAVDVPSTEFHREDATFIDALESSADQPNLLGRDVLQHFRLCIDRNNISLEEMNSQHGPGLI